MTTNRVIVGYDASGNSAVVADDQLEAITSEVWSFETVLRTAGPITVPQQLDLTKEGGFPPPEGTWTFVWSIPPGGDGGKTNDADVHHKAGRTPAGGMHATDSVDVSIVLEGEITLELDNDVHHKYGPGQVIVMNGPPHMWSNSGTVPTKVFTAVLGAKRAADPA